MAVLLNTWVWGGGGILDGSPSMFLTQELVWGLDFFQKRTVLQRKRRREFLLLVVTSATLVVTGALLVVTKKLLGISACDVGTA